MRERVALRSCGRTQTLQTIIAIFHRPLLIRRIQRLILAIVQRLLPLLRIRLLGVMLHVILALRGLLRRACSVVLWMANWILYRRMVAIVPVCSSD